MVMPVAGVSHPAVAGDTDIAVFTFRRDDGVQRQIRFQRSKRIEKCLAHIKGFYTCKACEVQTGKEGRFRAGQAGFRAIAHHQHAMLPGGLHFAVGEKRAVFQWGGGNRAAAFCRDRHDAGSRKHAGAGAGEDAPLACRLTDHQIIQHCAETDGRCGPHTG
ncbi:hypothetical protein Amal_03945 [Acetobacter malorum]|uniref:Uncharacterized protein n=1 Tax=Acetobacter malorum TaxID=178901 RepID=A0A177G3L7_9PROT|nr:hypothetical protein Amal_03945 [Acetobacter malorum]